MKHLLQYRAKTYANNWLYGYPLMDTLQKEVYIVEYEEVISCRELCIFESLSQNTGKIDRLKNDVFELDIVRILPDNFLSPKDYIDCVCIYDTDTASFRLLKYSDKPYEHTVMYDFTDIGDHGYFEVIGNIFDNPKKIDKGTLEYIKNNF